MYYYPAKDRVWYAGGMIAYRRAHAVTNRIVPQDEGAVHVTFLTGCALMLRVEAVRAAGMFDEDYFMYLEDVDLSRRLLAAGHSLLYLPGARFFHRMEMDEQTPLKTYFVTRNRLKLLDGASGVMDRVLGRLFVLAVLAVRVPRWLLMDPANARAAIAGVRDYLTGRSGGGSFMTSENAVRQGGTHAHRH
ncbi:MAG: glycosyltransferase family 2 protein [Ignavibacteriae bacterium]|nr:glycosyltransferase family 2 protein [Ignavibacteriota bacterium]